jgi:hypothetical protein
LLAIDENPFESHRLRPSPSLKTDRSKDDEKDGGGSRSSNRQKLPR